MSLSDCNSQVQRDNRKQTRNIPPVQRGGFSPLAWSVPVPSPDSSSSPFCPLLPPNLPCFGFLDIVKIFWEVVRVAEHLCGPFEIASWFVIYYHVVPNMSKSVSHRGRKHTQLPGVQGIVQSME